MTTEQFQIGADVGGTFTDVVLLEHGGFSAVKKILSTPPDYSEGIARGIHELLLETGISAHAVVRFVHATTVATNTVLEHKGARTALITTEGFRDVLEMRRLRIPVMYDIQYQKPAPLVPRRLRFEVQERMDADGTVNVPLNVATVENAASFCQREGVEAVAIAFLHSYKNPEHEVHAEAILHEMLGPGVYICRSSDVLPEIREYERTSTAVVNAYVAPLVKSYLSSLKTRLRAIGIQCSIEIMSSAGGVMRYENAIRTPAYLVESGPAAGVIASAYIARHSKQGQVISFDMGGTTAKATMIEGYEPAKTTEYEVGSGINLSSKLVKGGGYPIKLPFIDISEIGAGGGSIIKVDGLGRVSVGPESAGAVPGPACYQLGGQAATLTDALVVLGYINPVSLAGGSVRLNIDAAREAIGKQVADPLEKSVDDAACGVLALGVATMTRAVKAVSTYRGRDPRDFILHAFGGNGAVVACEIARELQMTRVIVPPSAGVFSAFGLLYADIEQEMLRTVMLPLRESDPGVLEKTYRAMEDDVARVLHESGCDIDHMQVIWQADLRYQGQAYELTVPLKNKLINLASLEAAFHREHETTYGYSADSDPIDIVNVRVTGRLASHIRPTTRSADSNASSIAIRDVYFGPRFGRVKSAIVTRSALSAEVRPGPLIVEDYDSTCVVPPDWSACIDKLGNIVLSVVE